MLTFWSMIPTRPHKRCFLFKRIGYAILFDTLLNFTYTCRCYHEPSARISTEIRIRNRCWIIIMRQSSQLLRCKFFFLLHSPFSFKFSTSTWIVNRNFFPPTQNVTVLVELEFFFFWFWLQKAITKLSIDWPTTLWSKMLVRGADGSIHSDGFKSIRTDVLVEQNTAVEIGHFLEEPNQTACFGDWSIEKGMKRLHLTSDKNLIGLSAFLFP